jgi:hypothetical protein
VLVLVEFGCDPDRFLIVLNPGIDVIEKLPNVFFDTVPVLLTSTLVSNPSSSSTKQILSSVSASPNS